MAAGARPAEAPRRRQVTKGRRPPRPTALPPAVFWNLSKVSVDDPVIISDSVSTSLTFLVSSVVNVPYGNGKVPSQYLQSTGTPQLAIITCFGSWDTSSATYDQRTIVVATLQS